MAEQEKHSVAPGLVKSSGYEKPKTRVINPTMQAAVEELPTVEKSVTFTQGYASSISFSSWLPVEVEINIENVEVVQDVKKDGKKEQKAQERFVYKPKEEHKPSDIELANMVIPEVKPQKQKSKLDEIVNMEIPVQEEVAETISKANVFETINTIQEPVEAKPTVNKSEMSDVKPFIKADKLEIRMKTTETGETVYMVGKDICDKARVDEYLQEICGKILAMDCKRIEIGNDKYTRQSDGSFKDSNNKVLSMDDMLALVHS